MKKIKWASNMAKAMIRSAYRQLQWYYCRLKSIPKSREELHHYWRSPNDGYNLPTDYLGEKITQQKRSRFLVTLIQSLTSTDAKVLE
ncbi:MAG: hypothetical protein ACREXR_19900, partial [Gammaproteobacteria bacterium]